MITHNAIIKPKNNRQFKSASETVNMRRFNFSGDLELVQESHFNFISEILQKKQYKGPDVRLENVGASGDNYMSNVKRVIITENGKTFKMIAKLAYDAEMIRMMAQVAMLFKNEHIVYTELLPKFVQIQQTAGVTPLFRFAECYGSSDEVPKEVILLEDLKEAGFDILNRFEALSSDTVKVVLKNLAIYHSLSFVLKHQDLELFNEIKSKLVDLYSGPIFKSEDGLKYFKFLEHSALSVLDDDKYKTHVRGSVSELFNTYIETVKGDVGSQYTVILQGDGWTNNIMFRTKDGTPSECIFIDYQLARESSPVYDIMYMLFSCTTHQQRLDNYHGFLDYYHNELSNSLQKYGLAASSVYPRDRLDVDLRRYGRLMFATSIMLNNTVIKNEQEAEKMKEGMNMAGSNVSDEAMEVMLAVHPQTVAIFKSRVEGLVDSFIEFGLL